MLYAIFRSSPESRNVVDSIHQNYELFYLRNIYEARDGIFHVVESYQDTAQAIKNIMDCDLESDYSMNVLFNQYIPQYHMIPLRYDTTAGIVKILDQITTFILAFPINLRKYQETLAKPALDGLNTMICAPTGSGKTIVAAYIIRNHAFELQRIGKRPPKVVFVVPTVSLVDQQERELKRVLGSFLTIKGIDGGKEYDFQTLIQSTDVIVLTPQILV